MRQWESLWKNKEKQPSTGSMPLKKMFAACLALIGIMLTMTGCGEETKIANGHNTTENVTEGSIPGTDTEHSQKEAGQIISEGNMPSADKQAEFLGRKSRYKEIRTYIESGGNLYGITEEEDAVLIKWNQKPVMQNESNTITIPENVEGYPVTAVDTDAIPLIFTETLVLPKTLKQVSSSIFDQSYIEHEDYDLREIVIPKETEIIEKYISEYSDAESGSFGEKLAKRSGEDMVIINGYLLKCISQEKVLTIPEGVTVIAEKALTGCQAETVILPDSVEEIYSIPAKAKEINIPAGVMRITLSSYERESPWFMDKVKRAGSGMVIMNGILLYCGEEEETVRISEGVWSISGAFGGKTAVKRIVLSGEVTELPAYAFAGCSSVEEIIISDSVREIGEGAFQRCTRLKHVVIPEGIREISRGCFRDCPKLEKVQLPQSVCKISGSAFALDNALNNINLPEQLQYIGWYAFSDCLSLEEVNIPDSVEVIGERAFTECIGLRQIHIGSGVKISGRNVFSCSQFITLWDVEMQDYVQRSLKGMITQEVVIELPEQFPKYITHERAGERETEETFAYSWGCLESVGGMRQNAVFVVHRGSPAEELIKQYQFMDGKEMYQYRYYE